jgi:hypothetical protein
MRPNLSRLRHHCRLDLYYSGIIATPTLLWYYAASCSSMRPNLISFVASCQLKSSSCRTTCSIIANLICRLVGRLAALLPTCLSPNNVGQTSSLHCYYMAFVVLTYLAYLIAVNTSYRSSLVLQTWAYKPLVALD